MFIQRERNGPDAVAHFPSRIFLVAPKFWPACVAPLFCPACSPMTPSPARNCSSVKSRLFSSDGLGPSEGPLHSGCLCAWKRFCLYCCDKKKLRLS